ncbi:MAG: hypothetical protein HWD61_08390 [Parachlamydiaceae bacterium]|nr:MAG: hypothetical protein HWD61_08390 [Parachlamydiaceae bacterium]
MNQYMGDLTPFLKLPLKEAKSLLRNVEGIKDEQLEKFKMMGAGFHALRAMSYFSKIEMEYSEDKAFDYLALYQQSLAEEDEAVKSFFQKYDLSKLCTIEQFKQLTASNKRAFCLILLIKPELYSEGVFNYLVNRDKSSGFYEDIERLKWLPLLESVILNSEDLLALLKMEDKPFDVFKNLNL